MIHNLHPISSETIDEIRWWINTFPEDAHAARVWLWARNDECTFVEAALFWKSYCHAELGVQWAPFTASIGLDQFYHRYPDRFREQKRVARELFADDEETDSAPTTEDLGAL